MEENNYWLVGAIWNNTEDKKDEFFKRGYWEMGWNDDDQPSLASKKKQIKVGDRIAIKSMRGQGQSTITIRAIGIVKDVDTDRIYINWILTDLNREVDSKGAFSTIHGPYSINDEWTCRVFCL